MFELCIQAWHILSAGNVHFFSTHPFSKDGSLFSQDDMPQPFSRALFNNVSSKIDFTSESEPVLCEWNVGSIPFCTQTFHRNIHHRVAPDSSLSSLPVGHLDSCWVLLSKMTPTCYGLTSYPPVHLTSSSLLTMHPFKPLTSVAKGPYII